jgi:HlyD family secretion protein
VQPGKVLLSLAAQGPVRIDASVDEKYLRLLQPGQKARAVADAFAHQPFDAVLSYLSPSVDAQRGTVDVRLQVPEAPRFLRPDMTVSVEMQVGQRQATLMLPSDAVRGADTPAPWVLVADGGVARRVPITLGLHGVGQVEVTQGLSQDDWVLLSTSPAAEGDRVRPLSAPRNAKGMDIPQGMAR